PSLRPWMLCVPMRSIPGAFALGVGSCFNLRNLGAAPTAQLGAICGSVVLAGLPSRVVFCNCAKWVAPRAFRRSVPIFKRRATSWGTLCHVSHALFHGHSGADGDLLSLAERQRCESIQKGPARRAN